MSDNPHQQGEWLVQRIGKVTASNAWKVCDYTKAGKPSAARQAYLMEIVTQRLTGQQTPTFVNAAMQWGIDQEGFARDAYEARTGNRVQLVGFIPHPTLEYVGASPDGLVGFDGAVDFKCPNSTTHLEYIKGGMPEQYIAQVQFQMWCCGTDWTDLVSYDPRMPGHLSMFIQRVPRDEQFIAGLESHVLTFLNEVFETITNIEEKMK